jgi:hypothetical protein
MIMSTRSSRCLQGLYIEAREAQVAPEDRGYLTHPLNAYDANSV